MGLGQKEIYKNHLKAYILREIEDHILMEIEGHNLEGLSKVPPNHQNLQKKKPNQCEAFSRKNKNSIQNT
jgi:hypothetical protein